MSRRSIYASHRVRLSIPFALRTGNATTNGSAVPLNLNLQNFRTAMVVVFTGTLTDGSLAFSVEESANGTTGWTAIPADRLEGTIAAVAATADDTVYEQGVIPDTAKPFLRVSAVQTGATTGGSFGALIILGSANYTSVDRT